MVGGDKSKLSLLNLGETNKKEDNIKVIHRPSIDNIVITNQLTNKKEMDESEIYLTIESKKYVMRFAAILKDFRSYEFFRINTPIFTLFRSIVFIFIILTVG